MELNRRSLEILHYLNQKNEYTAANDLQQIFSISPRTLRYNLNKIDDYLLQNGFETLQRKNKTGVFLNHQDKLNDYLESFQVPYIFNKQEIIDFIRLKLLLSDDSLTANRIGELFAIAQNTAAAYLEQALDCSMFRKDAITVIYRKGTSYFGEQIVQSSDFANIFLKSMDVPGFLNWVKTGSCNRLTRFYLSELFSLDRLKLTVAIIQHLEKYTGQSSDYYFFLQVAWFYILLSNYETLNQSSKQKLKLSEPEQKLKAQLQGFFPDASASLVHQIYQLLLFIAKTKGEQLPEDLRLVVNEMIGEMAKKYQLCLFQDAYAYNLLLQHIQLMIKRAQKGIEITNFIYKEFVGSYPQLFADTKKACKKIEEKYNITLTPYEVSYIAIYFATYLNQVDQPQESKKLARVLVCCVEGENVSNLIRSILHESFGRRLQIDCVPVRQLAELDVKTYDLVLTNVNLNIPNISPYYLKGLPDVRQLEEIADLLQLHSVQNNRTSRIMCQATQIKDLISETCSIVKPSKLELGIIKILLDENSLSQPQSPSLVFLKSMVQVKQSAQSWLDAVNLSAKPLLKKKYVEPRYVDKIIKNLSDFGSYMVVVPQVMVAHAGRFDGVNQSSLAVTTFRDGFYVDPDDFMAPIKLVFMLAIKKPKDNTIVAKLIKVLKDRELLERLMQETSSQRIYDILTAQLFAR